MNSRGMSMFEVNVIIRGKWILAPWWGLAKIYPVISSFQDIKFDQNDIGKLRNSEMIN